MKEEHETSLTPSPDDTATLPLVIGVDLGGTQIRTAVLQGARLLSRVGWLTGDDPTPERVIPRMYQAVDLALKEAHTPLEKIAGIGISAPGPLNNRTGVIYRPPNLSSWDGVPLRDMFAEHFKVPVHVENDANAAALGEYMFGAGRGKREVVYLTISTGIGGGIITDGTIVEGASGTAGELGHMTIDWRGDLCNCGNIGCLERISSGTAIARKANEAIAQGRGDTLLAFAQQHQRVATTLEVVEEDSLQVSAHTVALAAEAGIPLARKIIATAAEALGVGLVNIIHIFNPEVVILGGGVTQMGPLLLDPARQIVAERTMKTPREAAHIVLAELGANVGLVGAGALIYYYKDAAI